MRDAQLELIVYDNKEGNPPAPTDIWHTDETFREAPPMSTALCSKDRSEVGGDTAFASMTAVYEGLSDRWQRFLSGLDRARLQPFRRRRMTLEMLCRKTLIHEYQYRHHWRPNMLVFWDNRNVQHSALNDYYPQRRLMERVTIAGTQPIPEGPAADHRNCAATSCRAKSKPGSINFGSGGNGTGAHLALEMFKSRAGIDVLHVPYKGNGPALTGLHIARPPHRSG